MNNAKKSSKTFADKPVDTGAYVIANQPDRLVLLRGDQSKTIIAMTPELAEKIGKELRQMALLASGDQSALTDDIVEFDPLASDIRSVNPWPIMSGMAGAARKH